MAGELDQAIDTAIGASVKAKIEAEVLKALSGDDVFATFISAALNQQVEIKTDRYRSEKVPFITSVLRKAIQDSVKNGVAELITEMQPELHAEIKKALRRNMDGIADSLTKSLTAAAERGYGFKVDLTMNVPNQ